MFWTIPDAMIIALAVTKFIQARKNNVFKVGVLATAVALIVVCGKNAFKENEYSKAENWYKLNNEVIEVCDIMFNYDENVRCVAPMTLYSDIRQYKEDIFLMFGRDITEGMLVEHQRETDWFIHIKIEGVESGIDDIFDYTRDRGYNFIVLYNYTQVQLDVAQSYGYIQVAITDNYKIFYNELLEN